MGELSPHARGQTHSSCAGRPSPQHWSAGEAPSPNLGKHFLQNTSEAYKLLLWWIHVGSAASLLHVYCAFRVYCASFCIWCVFSALNSYFNMKISVSAFAVCSGDNFIFTLFKVLSIPLSRAFYSPITVWPAFIGISTQQSMTYSLFSSLSHVLLFFSHVLYFTRAYNVCIFFCHILF